MRRQESINLPFRLFIDVDLRNCQVTKCCKNRIHISGLQNTLRRRPTRSLCRGNVNGEVSFNAIVPDTDDKEEEKEEEEEDVIPNVFDRLSVQEMRQRVLEQPEKTFRELSNEFVQNFLLLCFSGEEKKSDFFQISFLNE